jgi:peptide/nickel transport system permease protein
MSTARLVRGEVLSLREREFVLAARVLGMPTYRVLIKELMPNLAAPIIISISLMLPAFVAAEAGLAFLGIGVTSGQSWGQTIAKAVKYFEQYPLYLWEPLIGVVLLVLSLNLLGDAIRDALDPKTRR